MDTLLEMFDEIADVRDSTGKRHCLSHILAMSVCSILNKQIDFEDIHDYALAHKEYFNKKLGLWNGIPCAATFRNVFRLIKPENFLKVFMEWIKKTVAKQSGKQIIICPLRSPRWWDECRSCRPLPSALLHYQDLSRSPKVPPCRKAPLRQACRQVFL